MGYDPLQAQEILTTSLGFESAHPRDIIKWAVERYGSELTMTTSFGLEGMTIIHMFFELNANIRIVNIDTGYQFPETLKMIEKVKARYGFDVERIHPATTVSEYESIHGGKLYKKDPNQCCFDRKVLPLQKALANVPAWISSIRREQTPIRAKADIIEKDNKFNNIKINPLANWKRQDVSNFITDNKIIYHPLYDRDFTSIGCWPCTRATKPNEKERAGRWSGFEKLECGLHTERE